LALPIVAAAAAFVEKHREPEGRGSGVAFGVKGALATQSPFPARRAETAPKHAPQALN
jgi:hypothetical protein